MAKFSFELEVESREVFGKGASRRLRRKADEIPAIVYGAEEAPQSIRISHNSVLRALENEAFYSHILTLSHKGKKQKVVVKAIQRHPYKSRVLHMDFLRVSDKKPITMHVPLHFLGQDVAPGVVKEGGNVTHHMVELEIKCLPANLPEYIEVDLTDAVLDTIVHLSQVKLPKGVELQYPVHGGDDDLPVVSIHKPKRIEVEEEAVEATATPVEATAQKKEADAGKGGAKGNNNKK
jgi:large subunit ribosomal protein L25